MNDSSQLNVKRFASRGDGLARRTMTSGRAAASIITERVKDAARLFTVVALGARHHLAAFQWFHIYTDA